MFTAQYPRYFIFVIYFSSCSAAYLAYFARENKLCILCQSDDFSLGLALIGFIRLRRSPMTETFVQAQSVATFDSSTRILAVIVFVFWQRQRFLQIIGSGAWARSASPMMMPIRDQPANTSTASTPVPVDETPHTGKHTCTHKSQMQMHKGTPAIL